MAILHAKRGLRLAVMPNLANKFIYMKIEEFTIGVKNMIGKTIRKCRKHGDALEAANEKWYYEASNRKKTVQK